MSVQEFFQSGPGLKLLYNWSLLLNLVVETLALPKFRPVNKGLLASYLPAYRCCRQMTKVFVHVDTVDYQYCISNFQSLVLLERELSGLDIESADEVNKLTKLFFTLLILFDLGKFPRSRNYYNTQHVKMELSILRRNLIFCKLGLSFYLFRNMRKSEVCILDRRSEKASR